MYVHPGLVIVEIFQFVLKHLSAYWVVCPQPVFFFTGILNLWLAVILSSLDSIQIFRFSFFHASVTAYEKLRTGASHDVPCGQAFSSIWVGCGFPFLCAPHREKPGTLTAAGVLLAFSIDGSRPEMPVCTTYTLSIMKSVQ